jgi:uroporphyrinogen-III synthase
MTRVLITRPEPGATRTLNALLAKGIKANAVPLTEIRALSFDIPTGEFDALIVTSQNAVVFGNSILTYYDDKPVFTVGKRTAESLQNHPVSSWAETAEALLPKILTQAPKRLLYICGQTRRPELELGVKAAGIQIEAVEIYSAVPTENASERLERFFKRTKNSMVLFHAPSAADAFVSAINLHSLSDTTRFLCLSAAIATHLPAEWQYRVSIADRPDENAMFDQLDKMLA